MAGREHGGGVMNKSPAETATGQYDGLLEAIEQYTKAVAGHAWVVDHQASEPIIKTAKDEVTDAAGEVIDSAVSHDVCRYAGCGHLVGESDNREEAITALLSLWNNGAHGIPDMSASPLRRGIEATELCVANLEWLIAADAPSSLIVAARYEVRTATDELLRCGRECNVAHSLDSGTYLVGRAYETQESAVQAIIELVTGRKTKEEKK
jgi:hypothetical protein